MLRKHAPLLTVVLAIVLGAQQIRILFPSIGWYLRDTERVGVLDLVPYALAPFALGLLAPLLVWLLRPKFAFVAAGIGLFSARFLEQITLNPTLDLWASMIGVASFLLLLTLLLSLSRRAFLFGALLGMALDTALKGTARTLEFSWMQSPWGTIVVLLLLVWFLYFLYAIVRTDPRLQRSSLRAALPLLGMGPFFFLQWLILNNQGWQATANGWPLAVSLLSIALGNVAAIWLAAHGWPWLGRQAAWLRIGAVLVAVVLMWQSGYALSLLGAVGVAGAGVVLAALVGAEARISAETDRHIWLAGLVLGVSWLLFVGLGLLYYMALELALPVGMSDLPPIAAALVGVCAVLGAVRPSTTASADPSELSTATSATSATSASVPLLAAAALTLIPLLLLAVDWLSPPPEPPSADTPLTVMTYNIHSGMGIDGQNGLERIADHIDASGADVIGFQELSRGWMLDGSVEILGWLSHRLDMPYMAFVATVDDPLWGNAILSRYPLQNVETGLLPALGTLIGRGFVSAEIDTGGEPVLFTSTHLQHRGTDERDLETIQLAQLDVLLDAWGNRPNTILVGDFNARPGWPQIDAILDAGFVDSWAEAGEGPGYTANARDLQYRIDWVFHTPDLSASDAFTIESMASDHLPVVVEMAR